MSNTHKRLTSSSPIPPNIPTSFETDDGIATPIDNEIIISANDSEENNDNGLTTKGGVHAGEDPPMVANEVRVFLTNRIQGSDTSEDATPIPLWTFPIDTGDNNTYTFDSTVSALAIENVPPNTAKAAGFKVFGTVVTDGLSGTASIVGSTANVEQRDAFLGTLSLEYVIAGSAVSLMAKGIGQNVFWKAVTYYTTIQDV
jgi:hypothetical protein